MSKIHPKIKAQIEKVTGKRSLAVIHHIVQNGRITTEELKEIYGYNHPPRAARDVREQGVPLDTIKVRGSDGRLIAAYVFGDPSKIEQHKLGGRKIFTKAFKKLLIEQQGSICAVTGEPFHPRYLSIDHRIPYEVAGDQIFGEDNPSAFMLISAAAQRQKSWSCEQCENWTEVKNPKICKRCYWAFPENYKHIAMEERRRIEIVWIGSDEVAEYEQLQKTCRKNGVSLILFIKQTMKKIL
ncbi:MAG: HNH endonuclease [Phycisphaerae bacterium]|nr:HNH endonuclease [Phycisphaerae bacterium]